MSDLTELRQRMNAAEAAYIEARRTYEAALCAAHPYQPGDIIRSSKGDVALVKRISMKFGRPAMLAVLRKKDGNFGAREASMWRTEWKVPERIGRADP